MCSEFYWRRPDSRQPCRHLGSLLLLANLLRTSISSGADGSCSGRDVVVRVPIEDFEVQVICGEDAGFVAARIVTERRTHRLFPRGEDALKLAREVRNQLIASAPSYVPVAVLDAGSNTERPRDLTTAGAHSRRAHEHFKKEEYRLAIADLLRALLRPTIDDTSKQRLSGLLDSFIKKAHQKIAEKAKDGDLSELFEALGLEDDALSAVVDQKAVKRVYRELSVKYHPDKNPGYAGRFNVIRDAYEVLSDPVKTLLYDTGGIELVRKYEGSNSDIEMGPNNELNVVATLRDVYLGAITHVRPKRRVVCPSCRLRNELAHCRQCKRCPGEMQRRQVWLNQHQYRIEEHEEKSNDFCMTVTEELAVSIDKGAIMGDRVQFPNMADQKPKQIPGDVLVMLTIQKHPLFKRVGNDLHISVKVSLLEALLGFERELTHLDGHIVKFGVQRGTVLRPGHGLVIDGEGMPLKEDPSTLGRLIVAFDIEFPAHIPADAAGNLETSLRAAGINPPTTIPRIGEAAERRSEL